MRITYEYCLIIVQTYFISVHLQYESRRLQTNTTIALNTRKNVGLFPSRSLVNSDVYRMIKRLEKTLAKLHNHSDSKSDEIEELKKIEKDVLKLKNDFKENTNFYSESKTELVLERIYSEIGMNGKKVEFFEILFEARKKERLYSECIKLVKSKRFDKAAINLDFINDIQKTNSIIDTVFNSSLDNFDLVDEFAKEVPSIRLTYAIYYRLKRNLDLNFDIDNEIGSKLIESLSKNVIEQISVDPINKLKTLELMEEVETKIKPTLIDAMRKFIIGKQIEIRKVMDRITYGTSNFKFFNEILTDVMSAMATKNFKDKIERIKTFKPTLRLITLKNFYDKIFENGVSLVTVSHLMTIKKVAQDALEEEPKEWDEANHQIYKSIPDPKFSIVRVLKNSLISNFSEVNDILEFSKKVFINDNTEFLNAMRSLIEEIYDKKDTLGIIVWMRNMKKIDEMISAFKAIFEKMKERTNLNINSKTVSGILKLENYVNETFRFRYFKNVDLKFVTYLKDMKSDIIGSKDKVKTMLKKSIVDATHGTEDFQKFCVEIFSTRFYGACIEEIIQGLVRNKTFEEEYKQLESILHYTDSHKDLRLKISNLINLQDEILQNKIFYFEIAERYKKIFQSQKYESIDSEGKTKLETNKNKLPSSIRNVVFCKKVSIKSMTHGEYLYLDQYQNESAAFSLKNGSMNDSFWIIEYTGEKGVYTIKNERNNEYLYPGGNQYNLDNNHRLVISSRKATGKENWQLIPTQGGGLLIKNVFYNEFLFTSSRFKDSRRRNVLTYRVGSIKGKWKIQCLLENMIHL